MAGGHAWSRCREGYYPWHRRGRHRPERPANPGASCCPRRPCKCLCEALRNPCLSRVRIGRRPSIYRASPDIFWESFGEDRVLSKATGQTGTTRPSANTFVLVCGNVAGNSHVAREKCFFTNSTFVHLSETEERRRKCRPRSTNGACNSCLSRLFAFPSLLLPECRNSRPQEPGCLPRSLYFNRAYICALALH